MPKYQPSPSRRHRREPFIAPSTPEPPKEQDIKEPQSLKDQKYDSSKSGDRSNMERRPKSIKVTLFASELNEIQTKAFQETKSVAGYVRDSALKRALPKARFTEEELQLLKDLPKIGSNLNQISRSLNRAEDLTDDLANKLKSAVDFINNIKSRFDK